ncbi:hypothetical protein ACFQT0_01900 [Hymenobacter humi]|uniref:DUF3185 family protein n=1 Tax=Hymenobacter humi TaxID=1411620 RepID=A0ABW2U0C0_9BACT
MRKLSFLLAGLFLFSLFCWLNNRVSYKYEADLAETVVVSSGGTQAAVAKVQARGQELDQQLTLIKAASIGLVIALALSIYKTPKE